MIDQSLISPDECQLELRLNMAVPSGNDRIFDVLSRDGNIVVIGTFQYYAASHLKALTENRSP